MLDRAREIYLQSKKRQDNFWTEWISRPPAALVVMALEPTPITPNQVTFLSLIAFLAGAAVLVAVPTHAGLILAVCVTQFSYILDCADGQLARLKKLSSPVGGLLDFLMDEIKAFLLVGAAAVRLARATDDERFLYLGLGGLVVVASGIAITTFMRRPEYLGVTSAPAPAALASTGMPAKRKRSPIALAEALGSTLLHYPSYILFVALFNRLDLFFYVYLGAHFLYLGKATLTIFLKLGRFAVAPAPRQESPVTGTGESGAS